MAFSGDIPVCIFIMFVEVAFVHVMSFKLSLQICSYRVERSRFSDRRSVVMGALRMRNPTPFRAVSCLNQSVSVGNERNELSVLHLWWLHVVLWHSGYRLHSTTVAVLFVGNSSPSRKTIQYLSSTCNKIPQRMSILVCLHVV